MSERRAPTQSYSFQHRRALRLPLSGILSAERASSQVFLFPHYDQQMSAVRQMGHAILLLIVHLEFNQ
jgi:hypothetical protein